MPCLPGGTRMTPVVSQNSVVSPTRSQQLNAGLHNLWQPGLKVVTIEIIEIVTTIIVTMFKRCNNLNML